MPLCRLLEARGAHTLRLAPIEIEAGTGGRTLSLTLGALEEFDLIVFHQRQCRQIRRLAPGSKAPAAARSHRPRDRPSTQPGGLSRGRAAARRCGFGNAAPASSPGTSRGPAGAADQGQRRPGAAPGRAGSARRAGGRGRRLSARGGGSEPGGPRGAARPLPSRQGPGDHGNQRGYSGASAGSGDTRPARRVREVHWVLPGDRIAAAVRARGLSAPLLRAESAEDQDLVAALVRWRSTASGA